MKWIKGVNTFTNSVGLTFESLLNKQSDSMFFPDYQGIEIKCTQRFSRYPISIFSSAFDGPSLYEMNEILNKYGKQDIIYRDKKILNASLNCNEKTLVNNKYYFKLDISEKGRQRNKNLVFKIEKDNISKLFKTIKKYNADLN